ncbi:MAG: HEAT repeat domain-containing protein [Acidobacteriota bacterium]|nr:HEAT repeat domain-containing protein [Acidobacteriota bacterium]
MKPARLLIPCLLAAAAFAQQPNLRNARLVTRDASAGLDAALSAIVSAQDAPAWAGYAVPIVAGDHRMCCSGNGACLCTLERQDGRSITNTTSEGNKQVQLEGPTHLFVLYRIESRQIGKVRTFTPDCELDAGGVPFFWLNGVKASDSVRYLKALAESPAQERRNKSAATAIAFHQAPEADSALDDFVKPTQPEFLRRDAVFWLGQTRGHHGFEVLSRVVKDDPSDRIREHAVFSLMQSKDPGAVKVVIAVAHDDKAPHVRGQALFWLAQRAGNKIAGAAIAEAIEKDPETEVKKKAVFALSQIPHGDGVPLLIEVAKTNRNPAVRKQAVFWLGQSKDPRAATFLEEILTR